MAACVTVWRGTTGFSHSASRADQYGSKAKGSSVMRQSVPIVNGCNNVSKQMSLALKRKLLKVAGRRHDLCVTSAGSSEKFQLEELPDDIQNTDVPDTLIDQTLGTKSSVNESTLTANGPTDDEETFDSVTEKPQKLIGKKPGTKGSVDKSTLTAHGIPTDDEETSESTVVLNAFRRLPFEIPNDLLPWTDCLDEANTKDVSTKISSSESSSFGGPLLPPDSRVMIEVINKLLKLLLEILEPAITQLNRCRKLELIMAIILTVLWFIDLAILALYFPSEWQ